MKRLSFFWDMDGTLVDSYPAIVPAAQKACARFGMEVSAEDIRRQVILTSVGTLLDQLAAEHGIDPAPVKAYFTELNDTHIESVRPIPNAEETLVSLTQAGHLNYIYTHRGASCRAILRQTHLEPYFTEIITALDGFPRKPAPDAILYLMEKHRLRPEQCFYIGDRSLDVDAAVNAGIGSILFLEPGNPGKARGNESFVIHDLLEIPDLFREEVL